MTIDDIKNKFTERIKEDSGGEIIKITNNTGVTVESFLNLFGDGTLDQSLYSHPNATPEWQRNFKNIGL